VVSNRVKRKAVVGVPALGENAAFETKKEMYKELQFRCFARRGCESDALQLDLKTKRLSETRYHLSGIISGQFTSLGGRRGHFARSQVNMHCVYVSHRLST
jgi:hypothetical protein